MIKELTNFYQNGNQNPKKKDGSKKRQTLQQAKQAPQDFTEVGCREYVEVLYSYFLNKKETKKLDSWNQESRCTGELIDHIYKNMVEYNEEVLSSPMYPLDPMDINAWQGLNQKWS